MSKLTSPSSCRSAINDPDSLPRYFTTARICGTSVTVMTLEDMHRIIAVAIETGRRWIIANHNLHSLYLLQRELRKQATSHLHHFYDFYQRADFTTIDGMSMVVVARALGHHISRCHRFSYSHTLRVTLRHAERSGWRVFYLGSSPSTVAKANDIIKTDFPDLPFAAHHGFFAKSGGGSENKKVLEEIASFHPHLLFVGMGMPIQEYWINENYDKICANVIVTSGASLDYLAGTLRTPPAWVGNAGLQWLYRLITEPRRLGHRYLVEPLLTLWYIAGNRLRGYLMDYQEH
jgi:N-acetylglucosaminyldiphosphoundecaprenol N-acetyl-beta-D-mannosaminyltransferase